MRRRRPSSTRRAGNRGAAHVRDAIDLKRMMILVWFAVFPAMFWGMYNVGLQTIPALHKLYGAEQLQQAIANNWHYSVAQWLGVSFSADAGWLSMMAPARYFSCLSTSPSLSSAASGRCCSRLCASMRLTKVFRYLYSLRVDCAAHAAAVAGGAGDLLRRGDRQRDFRRHRAQLLNPALAGARSCSSPIRRRFPAISYGPRRTVSPAPRRSPSGPAAAVKRW